MSDMASLRSALSLDYSAWDCVLEEADSLDGGSFETETDEAAAYTACEFLTSMETPSHEEFVIGDDEGRQSPVSWTSLFALQTEVFILFLLKSVVSSLHSLHQCFSKQLVREQFVPSLVVQGTCQCGRLYLSVNGQRDQTLLCMWCWGCSSCFVGDY